MYAREDYGYMFYPPPFDFLVPGGDRGRGPLLAPAIATDHAGRRVMVSRPVSPNSAMEYSGLGSDCGCGCGGHGGCGGGLGLFDNPLDLASWGLGEWLTIGAGVYLAYHLFSDAGKVSGKARRYVRTREAKKRRKQQLRDEIARL